VQAALRCVIGLPTRAHIKTIADIHERHIGRVTPPLAAGR